mmetsp:Transcript_7265/g.10710  ORF Transcript_7265/g.10710 Transcript_7265/m.10710 type:complete len:291 (-) Transcript_7265:102-974(-)
MVHVAMSNLASRFLVIFLPFVNIRRDMVHAAFQPPSVSTGSASTYTVCTQNAKTCHHYWGVRYDRYMALGMSLQEEVAASKESKTTTKVYFDIGLDEKNIGRLVFDLKSSERLLPTHTKNLIKLATGEMRSIDPRLGYVKCAFKHSPQFVEGFSQYRWAHVLDGRGRNAVGNPTERIQADPDNLRSCTHSIYGGVYYGLEYSDDDDDDGDDVVYADGAAYGVVLTVPLVGAYRGSTGFSIVRVGESPQEWKERLLLNSAVLGYLVSGIDVLHHMARQTDAPPTILASGKL